MRPLKWLQETKGSIGAIIFALGLVVSLVAAAKVPAKLDAHMLQASETNAQLRRLVCLTAKLHSVAQCLADTK